MDSIKGRVAAVLSVCLFLFPAAGCAETREAAFLYKDLLGEEQAAVYRAFESSLKDGFPEDKYYDLENTGEGSAGTAEKSDTLHAYQAFVYDHPELFRLGRSFGFRLAENTEETRVEAVCPFLIGMSEPEQAQQAFEEALEEAAGSIPDGLTETETAEYLYRYLTENVSYCERAVYDETLEQEHTAYGALVGKSAVCDGIALAYLCLLRQSGIPCAAVAGNAGGMRHVWVVFKTGGEWREADPTWGITKGTDYFGLTTKQMSSDHVRDADGPGSLAPESDRDN